MENQNPVQAQNQPLAPVQPQSTIEPTPPVQPESPPSNSSGFPFKRILILLIVLIIIVITGGAYVLNKNSNKISAIPSPTPISTATATPTPTPDPTAGWKTYTDSQYGYTIKYPSTVTYKQDRFYLLGDDNRKDTADGFGPNLAILFRSENSTPENTAKQELGSNTSLKDVSINNANGVQITNSTLGFDYYLTPLSGNKVMRLNYSSQNYASTVSKESINTMNNIANQMLSTFKFTDQTSPAITIPNGFPIYPGAVFIKKDTYSSGCDEITKFCNPTAFVWTSPDDFDKIFNWYEQEHSGWKCTGGAGDYVSPRAAKTFTFCENGNLKYSLNLEAYTSYTEFSIEVPTSIKP